MNAGWLRSSDWKFWVKFAAPLIAGAVLGLVIVWHSNRTPMPDRATAEQQLEDGLRSQGGEVANADCEKPSKAGWTCLLRTADGKYGVADATLSTQRHDKLVAGNRYGGVSYITSQAAYTWAFPVRSDGSVDETVELSGGGKAPLAGDLVSLVVSGVADNAARSVGAKEPDTSGISCPKLRVGATVTCTGPQRITVSRKGDDHYRVRLRQALPGSTGYRPDPTLPSVPEP